MTWAGTAPVPRWLDHARELSERWIHRQQLLQALGGESDLRPDLAEPVLDGLRWAYPFRLARHRRAPGDTVQVVIDDAGLGRRWDLVAHGTGWQFAGTGTGTVTTAGPVVARLEMTADQAWRLLTNNYDPAAHGALATAGDPEIVATLTATRAIIGAPK